MRRKSALSAVALLVPLVLAGCSVLGLDSAVGPAPSASATTGGPVSGAGWIVYASGSPTPSPAVPGGGGASPSPALPPVSFLPIDPMCAKVWTVEPPLIPIEVVPAAGALKVTWPRQYDSNYRITAVRQPLITGNQPAYPWQNIAAGTGCTVTSTITGLKPGTPYIVWLDAPNTGYQPDGTRHPYSGKSGVVYPL